jgi:hypothetical protein
MECLLQVLGVLALLGLGTVLGLFSFFRHRIRRWHFYGLAASIHKFPGRLSLRRLEPFQWQKPERAAQRVAAFRDLGFVEGGGFALEEIADARLFVLIHPINNLVAVVHEQEELGTWSDVLLFPMDAPPILASSILKRSHFFLLPGDPKVHKPGVSEKDLADATQAAAGRGISREVISVESFPKRFEEAFADATDSRLLQDLEDYEIRRLIQERNHGCAEDLKEKDFNLIQQVLPLAIENELRLTCGAQFVRETPLPASEWQRSRERLVVIHDRTPLAQLVQRLIYGAYWTKPLRRYLRRSRWNRGRTPRQSFAELNATLPPWERYKKIGEVTRPVPADIYRAPLETEST